MHLHSTLWVVRYADACAVAAAADAFRAWLNIACAWAMKLPTDAVGSRVACCVTGCRTMVYRPPLCCACWTAAAAGTMVLPVAPNTSTMSLLLVPAAAGPVRPPTPTEDWADGTP